MTHLRSPTATLATLLLLTGIAKAQDLAEPEADELVRLGAAEAAQLIRDETITSTALVSALLDRAERMDSLNAYVTLARDYALQRAREADRAVTEGQNLGRLHGVPIAVKDNIEVAGIQNTAGTPALIGYVPTENAPVVQALIDEGAIILGKNNMHELAMGITSNNAHFGAVGNPWKPDHFAGGSSGGTGAAVAADIATAGLGSDTGGSVRIPAAVNGVYGLRPTTGRYSQEGITPLSSTRDTAGPIAKSVTDLALLDAAITGHQTAIVATPATDIRLGVPQNYYFNGIQQDIARLMVRLIAKIAAGGVEVVLVELPMIGEISQAAGTPIRAYEGGPLIEDYLSSRTGGYVTFMEFVDGIASPNVQAVFAALASGENAVSEEDYQKAIGVDRPQLQKVFASAFKDHDLDAILFPTTPATARPIAGSDESIIVDGVEVPTFRTFVQNTAPGSLAGIPGVTLPAGLAEDGLPVGLSLDGPEGSDRALLSVALTIDGLLDVDLVSPEPSGDH